MKNKWTRVIIMILVGSVAVSMGQNGGGIGTIVGVILLVGGIVEAFKKQKNQPPTTP